MARDQAIRNAQQTQHIPRVGPNVDAGADLAQDLVLLVDVHVDVWDSRERNGRCEAAWSAADYSDAQGLGGGGDAAHLARKPGVEPFCVREG